MSSDCVRQLHQLVRDRPMLETGFSLAWRRMSRLDEAVILDWAAATLGLSAVNAGPACILAFWRAGMACDIASQGLVAAGGRSAATVCGYAGTKAALACIEAMPAAIRLAGTRPGSLAAWWQGLIRVAREAPGVLARLASRVELLLADGDGMAFADFVAAGLKATVKDKTRRIAFFALDDPLAQTLLRRRRDTAGFAEHERMLGAFVDALWSGPRRLACGPEGTRRTTIASGVAFLPPAFPGAAPALPKGRALYRAAAAHAYAHLAAAAVRHPVLQLKPVQVALIGLIEDARVEALAIRRFPGLRRLWLGFHDTRPGGPATVAGLLARLAHGLLDPDHTDPDGFVQKGRTLFTAADMEDPAISRSIGGLLGNDLGQMRLQFDARGYAAEPAYRDDNMHLWDLPDRPDDAASMTVESARGSEGDGEQQPGSGPRPQRARDAGQDPDGVVLATYPEWDAAAGVERPDWTTLREIAPELREPASESASEGRLRAQIVRLVRTRVATRRVRQARQESGETLDLDAAIAAAVAWRAGSPPDPQVYRDRRPGERDLSVSVILDVSQSTATTGADGRSVLDSERIAVSILASALDASGDGFALRAFASAGRDDVRMVRLKDFDEPLTPRVGARLAGLSPGLSTRLGTAIRHAGAELRPRRSGRKLVLVFTDGEPSDIDVADPQELVEDARRAVLGLRTAGIDVYGIVMDPDGAGSGTTIFGRHNSMAVARLDELPAKLAGVYFRLTQR